MKCKEERPNKLCIDVEGGKLFVRIEGDGTPIVLVHGFALNHQMWKYQVPYLTTKGYKVVAIDLRGFGNSSEVQGAYAYDTWAKDISTVIDALQLQHVTLVGFSLGGAIAMHYVTTRADPRIERLALVAAAGPYLTCGWDNIMEHWACFGRDPVIFDRLIDLINDRAYYQPILQIYDSELLRAQPADFQWVQDMLQSNCPDALIGALEEMRDKDLKKNLGEINVPTTIVGGWTDLLVPPGLIEEQKSLIANASCKMVVGGHGLFFEQVDELNRALTGEQLP
ncbi:MAG: alpha/beta hydrolase [Halobacteriota archaeon]